MCQTTSVESPPMESLEKPAPAVKIATKTNRSSLIKKHDHTYIWAGVALILLLILCFTLTTVTLIYKQKQCRINTINNLYNPDYFNISSDHMQSKFEELKSINSSERIISKKEWLARPVNDFIPEMKLPIKYVIICHTAARFCNTTNFCAFVVQWNQNHSMEELHKPDTTYNFFVGGDGNVYESRGWHFQNDFFENSITISMIGNFVFDELTNEMVQATKELLDYGVVNSFLDKDYKILAHNQTKRTMSPGPNVYKKIVKWPHYSTELEV